ncbi:MAG: type II toxin-antitoxin system VapC family toxin [Verrucomicrobia bacterium]|nr:type II toxin-antitoxin system VapC family toxin [Verrucomicrobiota bacterium]
MKYLLDTNVCIDAMRGREEVVARLMSMSPDDCAISTVSMFELEAGARRSRDPESELGKVSFLCGTLNVLSWNEEAAKAAAEIRVDLETAGRKIGAYDTLLAGHALALGLVLVTDNVKEFSRVEGLVVENWREK